MADGVLACDDGAIGEAGGDVMCEVTDNGREDGCARLVDAADDGKEVDSRFEGTGEKAGPRKEEIADGGGLEVEGR